MRDETLDPQIRRRCGACAAEDLSSGWVLGRGMSPRLRLGLR